MTDKEKARAYDEALERAKELIALLDKVKLQATQADIYEIFPELRESEDEKMLNQLHSWMDEFGGAEDYTEKVYQWIKGLIEKQKEAFFGLSHSDIETVMVALKESGLEFTSNREVYEKLEKQKESLHIMESCKENANSFTDEDDRIRKVLVSIVKWLGSDSSFFTTNSVTRSEVLAYLEKQKEKAAIPDELVKHYKEFCEKSGNDGMILIDVLNACQKQKEPLPIPNKFSGLKSLMLQYLQSAANRKDDTEIESDTDLFGRKILDYVWKYSDEQKEHQELPLMNGDADLYFDTWRQEVPVPTFRQCFEEGMRYTQRLQKEQKPLVYRMNGLMQDYIKDTKDPEEQEHRRKCYDLFWEALEDADYFKQKDDDIRSEVYGSLNPPPKIPEQKPADLPPGFYFIDLDGKKYYSKEFRYGDMKMKIVEDKSEKPAEWSEEQN